MAKLTFIIVFIALILNLETHPVLYEWRGENRCGIYNEEGLLTEWPESGPEEIWVVDGMGNGYGSPAVTENEIFISGEIDSIAWLFCLNHEGKILWKSAFGKEWVRSYPGSRSAPTIIDDFIYIGSGLGNLYCLKRENGEVVWAKDFNTDFEGQYPLHGHSDAAVISGEKVFWVPGGKLHNVVALNRFTGGLAWSCKGYGERSAYTPSKLVKLPSREVFVTFSAYNLMGIDAGTGQLLWTHIQDNLPIEKHGLGYGDTHSNTPLYEDGAIYYSAGDGNCGVKLLLSEDGSQIKEAWRNKEFDGFMGGIVKIGDYIYGTGTVKKELLSVNATTGELAGSLKIGSGAVIAAGPMLYYYNQRGELYLIETDNGQMKEVSSFRVRKGSREHFSHPVIRNGILYQRHGDVLMAFDIREKN